jgi:opacity protein-like surface antigen
MINGSALRTARQQRLVRVARKAAALFGLLMCVALAVSAQDTGTVIAPPVGTRTETAPAGFAHTRWQLALGYQYNRISLRGVLPAFSTNGAQVSVLRFFGNSFGLESQVGAGFGTAPTNLTFRSLFVGGGPHIALRVHGPFEPWVHGLAGIERINFNNSTLLGNRTSVAWAIGGGLDVHLQKQFAVRLQYDYLGTRFFGAYQRNSNLAAGLVWNF